MTVREAFHPTKLIDGAAIGAANLMTRKRFLRNAGTVALGATMGAAFFGRVDSAWATGTCYSIGNGPCGPSPLCSGNCNGAGECGSFCRRQYGMYNCPCNQVGNCWTECCTCDTSWAGVWSCCDCCGSGGGGNSCGCGTACICRKLVASCPGNC